MKTLFSKKSNEKEKLFDDPKKKWRNKIEEQEVESSIQSDVMIEEAAVIEEDNQVSIHDEQGIDKTQTISGRRI